LRFLLISNTAFFLITHLRIGYPLFWLMELRVDDALSRPWTLVTYSFLHANTFHLLINMLMLWMFGDEVAQHLGTRKFIAFYLIAALVAGLASLPFYGGVVVGASGALFGVMYLYAALFPDRVMLLFWIIPMRMSWGIWVLALFDLLATRAGDGVAHWAHLGGFLAGIVGAKILLHNQTSWRDRFHRWRWRRQAKQSSHGGVVEPEIGVDIDFLLRKISEQGLESLTSFEREALRREGERRRNQREEYHRWR